MKNRKKQLKRKRALKRRIIFFSSLIVSMILGIITVANLKPYLVDHITIDNLAWLGLLYFGIAGIYFLCFRFVHYGKIYWRTYKLMQ